MKKIYQAPTAKVHKVRPAAIICTSPNSGYSTQDIKEEENVVFETKQESAGVWDNKW